MSRGLDYILARQSADGAWSDWALPPGPAPHWTTAHIGRCLSQLPRPHPPHLLRALERAADWLCAHRLPGGAWGYNDRTEPDADSTSLSVLFLSAMNRALGSGPVAFLRQAQRLDGGFATFLPDGLTGTWGQSHAEVTAITLLALSAVPGGINARQAAEGLAWLRRHRRPDGTWSAYWWTTPYLTTGLARSCLAAFGGGEGAAPVLPLPDDSLQAAHLLSMMPHAATQHAALTGRLLDAQKLDGSWAGKPALRIPPRDCAAPWNEPESPVYADPNRLFTTATVISALSGSGAGVGFSEGSVENPQKVQRTAFPGQNYSATPSA